MGRLLAILLIKLMTDSRENQTLKTGSYELTLRFADAVTHTLQVESGESVLSAGLRQGVPILHQCQSGSCGSCVGHLTQGEAEMRKDVAASLLKSEQDAGMRLTCITQALTDATLDFDYASTVAQATPAKGTLFIDDIEWLSDDVVQLSAELAEEDWIDFKPGQFIQIRVPGSDYFRRYSMSSTPADLPKVSFLMRVLPQGLMSDYLRNEAQINDALEIEGPFGSFFLREESIRAAHIMVAGGTGLAPVISILDVIRSKSGPKPKVLLSFGCQDSAGLFYTDELELRAQWMPTLETRICIDRGEPSNEVHVGNPLQMLKPSDVSDETVAYLCGPPGMISAAHDLLISYGIKPDNIHAEQFVASA